MNAFERPKTNIDQCLWCGDFVYKGGLDECYQCYTCKRKTEKEIKEINQVGVKDYNWLDNLSKEIKDKIIFEAEKSISYKRRFSKIQDFLTYVYKTYAIKFSQGDFLELRKRYLKDNPEFEFKNKRLKLKE